MLSFIYRLVHDYEQEHGFRPNVLYLNRGHFEHMRQELAEIRDLGTMSHLLGMEIVLDPELTQPHVNWTSIDWRRAVAV